jgi:two-component system chemotaxis sensor kinase CheA
MDPAQLRQIFFGECDDYLNSANDHLECLGEGAETGEALNALFRAVHSIKGGARAFGIDGLAGFTHVFENFMDTLRKGRVPLDEDNSGRLTLGFDMLAQLVAEARGEPPGHFDYDGFIAGLRRLDGDDDAPPPPPAPAQWDEAVPDGEGDVAPSFRRFRLRVMPAPHMFTAGGEPLLLLRNLAELGGLTVTAGLGDLPPLKDLDIDVPCMHWDIELETQADIYAIREILEFVDDVATIEVEQEAGDVEAEAPPATGPAARPAAHPAAHPAAEGAMPAATAPVAAMPVAAMPVAAMPVAAMPVSEPQFASAAAPPARSERRVPTVRVDVPKLERLGNMVGELVIAQAVLQRQASDIPEAERPGLFRAIKDISQYIRDLQDIAMAVRAQPLKVAFSRLIPVARELERATGKKIRLAMTGEDTEIDKTVVDRLAEPLIHLLRNACDHGIEPREKRLACGKPAEGTIGLSAHQRGSQVFIVIQDDGGGINRAAVRAKALSRGLIEPGSELSDHEVDNLIFQPGFSTAQEVTEVSGRGVGMDVVRQTISDLGGQIVVESVPGSGTRFALVLPLSLAIIDVMVAELGRQRYLLPIGSVIESVRPLASQLVTLPGRGRYLRLRGSMIPIMALADEFAVPDAVNDPTLGILVVVELRRGQVCALLVDDVLGQEPVVVKSLERNYRKVPGIAAATILGDGKAALIVEFSGLRSLPGAGTRPADVVRP